MQHLLLGAHAVALHVQLVLQARDGVPQFLHLLFMILLQGLELLLVRVFHPRVLRGDLLLSLVELRLEVLDLQLVLDDVALVLIDQEVAAHLKLQLLLLGLLVGYVLL